MKTVPIILGVLIVLAGVTRVYLRSKSTARPVDGLSRHRKHMDALSSDARREVIDRVQRSRDHDYRDQRLRDQDGDR